MPTYVRETGKPTRVTATGATVLTSGPASFIGIQVAAVLTGQIVQLWTQSATSITGVPVLGTMTMLANTWYPVPGEFERGITYAVTNEDTDLTIFWNPAGSGSTSGT